MKSQRVSSPLSRSRRLVRERRGSALILVLVAMVVLLVLSSGALLGSMAELRTSRTLSVQQRALSVAEYGMNAQLGSWPTTRGTMANGAIDSTVVVVQSGDTARVRVQRLNRRTFNVVSIGRASIGNGLMEAQRSTSMLVRLVAPRMTSLGSLIVYDDLDVQGSPVLDGKNRNPPGWDCLGYPTSDSISIGYNSAHVPDVQKAKQTPSGTKALPLAADTSTYSVFGDETWASLTAAANIMAGSKPKPEPVGSLTACTYGDENWGEPSRGLGAVIGCQSYYPIIYASGDLQLNNGRGQGILLVEGKLKMEGNFQFNGIIIVRGQLDIQGTPVVYGTVMSRAVGGKKGTINGNAEFNFSHCAIQTALKGVAAPRRTALRSWAQIY